VIFFVKTAKKSKPKNRKVDLNILHSDIQHKERNHRGFLVNVVSAFLLS